MFKPTRAGILLFAAAWLSGCAITPESTALPELELEAHWTTQDPAFSSADIATGGWWREFNDAVLEELIQVALQSNADIRVALANIEQARAHYGLERWSYLPAGGLEASRERGTLGAMELHGERPFTTYRTGLGASWEIDLFGRIRNRNKLALAELTASAAYADSVRLLVASEVASTYYLARASYDRRQIITRTLADQRDLTALTRVLVEEQRSSPDILDSALAELADTEVALLQEQEYGTSLEHRMAVLLGRQPGQWQLPEFARTAAPLNWQTIAVGNVRDMLRSRPDIRHAEQALLAQQAAAGIVRADYFPTLSLAGVFGFIAGSSGDLGASATRSWLAGPSLVWDVLDFGRIGHRLAAANAGTTMALANYEAVVLRALEETENALLRYATVTRELHYRETQRGHAQSAATAAQARYEEGVGNYLEVLIARRDALHAESAHINSLAGHRLATIEVFKALGSNTL